MRKKKKSKYDDFLRNEAFEKGEIKGIDVSAKYDSGDILMDDVYDDGDVYEEAEVIDDKNAAGTGVFSAGQLLDKIPGIAVPDEEIISDNKPVLAVPVPATQASPGANEINAEELEPQLLETLAFKEEVLASLRENDEPKPDISNIREFSIESKGTASNGLLSRLFSGMYGSFYMLGIQSFRYGKRVFSRLGRILLMALRYLHTLIRIFVIAVDRLLLKSVHAIHEESAFLRKEIRSSLKYLRLAFKEDPLAAFPIFIHYTKKTFSAHKQMFKTVFNLALPAAALIVFWLTLNYWNSVTFALQVTYSNADTVYFRDESVYISALAMANERLGTVGNAEIESEIATQAAQPEPASAVETEKPEYKLALVDLNKLSDDETICDIIIDNSVQDYANACGVFIDSELICTVMNEADATGVFDSILAPYKSDPSNTVVSFVEEVKFVQGLYPDNSKRMDAIELKEKLNTMKKEAEYYVVNAGETVWDIAGKNNLSDSDVLKMNPNLGNGENIKAGDEIFLSAEVKFIRVKLIKTENRNEDIAFETVKTDNNSLFKGDTKTIRNGVLGKESVKELVTYIDGVRISAEEIERVTVLEPISQKVEIGTKSKVVYSQSGTYTVSVSKGGFVWPVPACHTVSSPYGYRGRGFHNGIDIAGGGTGGKVIVAAKDGVVESVSSGSSLGVYVVINHGGGIRTGYGHCMSGSVSVSAGQHVSAGQAIARVGATGNATGSHLHFNVIINGSNVNPRSYVG